MPGTDLNLDLPTLADPFSTIVSELITAIEAIEADLAERVTAGELDITTALSMGGAPLTNVGGVRLTGGESAVVGTLYMDEDLHAVTPTGDVQLTLNGGLNVTALGTIGGDYGGANPAAVTYNDAAGEFRFTESTGVYADLRAEDIILVGANGTVRLGATSDITGDQTLYVKSLPASGVGLMSYEVADGALIDASTVRATLTPLLTRIDTNTLLVNTDIDHGDFRKPVQIVLGVDSVNMGRTSNNPLTVTSSSTSWFYYTPLLDLREGDRIKSAKLRFSGNTLTNTVNFEIGHYRFDGLGGAGTVYSTNAQSTAVSGHLTATADAIPVGGSAGDEGILASDGVMLDRLFIRVSGQASGVVIEGIDITWDHPE